MRRLFLALPLVLAALPALAAEGDFPQSPKIGPPTALPEPVCDPQRANNGGWLLGNWVAPHMRWRFAKEAGGLTWALDRKGTINEQFGWENAAKISGPVVAVSGCTVRAEAVKEAGGGDAFAFEGVLTEDGKLYGVANNKKGKELRLVLRRER